MKKGFYWVVRLALLAAGIKALLWVWQAHEARDAARQPQQVLDVDKVCSVIADTGQCFCHHRETKQRLAIPYQECKSLAVRH